MPPAAAVNTTAPVPSLSILVNLLPSNPGRPGEPGASGSSGQLRSPTPRGPRVRWSSIASHRSRPVSEWVDELTITPVETPRHAALPEDGCNEVVKPARNWRGARMRPLRPLSGRCQGAPRLTGGCRTDILAEAWLGQAFLSGESSGACHHNYPAVRRVPRAQLHHPEEQAQRSRSAGVAQVLP